MCPNVIKLGGTLDNDGNSFAHLNSYFSFRAHAFDVIKRFLCVHVLERGVCIEREYIVRITRLAPHSSPRGVRPAQGS